MLQPHVEQVIGTAGYPFPLLPTLALEFGRLGHSVSIVTTASDVTEVQKYSGEWLSVVVVPSRPRAKTRALDFFTVERRGVRDALRELSPDVIHAHWTYEFALGSLESKSAPVLVTAHDAPLTVLKHMPDPYRLLRMCMSWSVRGKTRNLTAVSPYLAHQWRRQMLFRGPIEVIPNPSPPFGESTVQRSSTPIVLDVADGSRRKNVRALLHAFPSVLEEFPEAELRLIGPGLEPDGAISAWARANVRSHNVLFLGRLGREEVQDELARATVYCHPSLEESQGISLIEAMNARLPVVAGTNSGSVPWTLFEGQAAKLVDVRRPEALAAGIVDAMTHRAEMDIAIERVADLARARYGAADVALQYLRRYSALVIP